MNGLKKIVVILAVMMLHAAVSVYAAGGSITYEPGEGPGGGRHIVFVCGEWEYRCEESLPMMAKILAERHGFKCTVLFSMNPEDGTVDPAVMTNLPDMELLKTADMMVVFAMDLKLPDDQMKHFADFIEGDKPVFGIRCSLLSFKYGKDMDSKYAGYDHNNKTGGYPQDLFGLVWSGHYGHHAVESTRGLRAGLQEKSPLLRGVYDVWGPTDVYRVPTLPEDATVYLYGQVLTGMNPTDPPNLKKCVMPMVWTREIKGADGKMRKGVFSTIGASQDMESEDLRRLHVNCTYWAMGLEGEIPEKADVRYVGGDWKASTFGRDTYRKGLKPADYAVKQAALPKVLIVGDSISGGYSKSLTKLLDGKAEVVKLGSVAGYRIQKETFWHSRGIAKNLDFGSAKACIADFERFGKHLEDTPYDVIHFNFGLNDIFRGRGGAWHNPVEQYEKDLTKIVALLKGNGARVIWASTTPIPDHDDVRPKGDDLIYNAAAEKVMKKHSIPINDLHGVVTGWDGYAEWKKGDDVHFGAAVYLKLAEQIAEKILAQVATRLGSWRTGEGKP